MHKHEPVQRTEGPKQDQTLGRRAFVRGFGALGGLTLLSRSPLARAAGGAVRPLDGGGRGRTLVLLQLAGGNDGLSTVVPFADDGYYRARRNLAVGADEVLRLDGYRGLHPRLEKTRALWDRGELAIVEGVGYPQPNRSHFKSLDIWHTGDMRGRDSGDGWIGRLCEARHGEEADPNRVVHVGGRAPYSLHSTVHPAACFSAPAGYRWVSNEEAMGEIAEEQAGGGPLDAIRGVLADARRSSLAVRAAAAAYSPRVDYPSNNGLAEDLRIAAALIQGGVGAEVISVELSGFDTHNNQNPRHRNLMGELDAALGAFLDDLRGTPAGRSTTVLAYSEFGRRVAENGSGGTDHGKAGPVFVAGEAVRGGLHGSHPSLSRLDDGDLAHTTDFRSVYACLADEWFGVDSQELLGARFPRLALLSA